MPDFGGGLYMGPPLFSTTRYGTKHLFTLTMVRKGSIMSTRSTRNKLRHQASKASRSVGICMEHLNFLDELADHQSEYINQNLPIIVAFVNELEKLLENFRDGL